MKCGREKESKGRYISVAEIVREAVREFLDKKRVGQPAQNDRFVSGFGPVLVQTPPVPASPVLEISRIVSLIMVTPS